jgi:broad specificity phosphatase PhoE
LASGLAFFYIMRLTVIRHGRPEWRLPFMISLARFEHVSSGYDAAGLSVEGKRAIDALAGRLPKALILSSDLPRARDTAEIIGRGKGAIDFDAVFREVPTSRIATNLLGRLWAPAAMWSLIKRCCWVLGIGGCPEKPHAAWGRAAKAVAEVLKHSGDESVILVSHGCFIAVLVLYLRWRGLIDRGPLLPRVGYGAATEYWLRTG